MLLILSGSVRGRMWSLNAQRLRAGSFRPGSLLPPSASSRLRCFRGCTPPPCSGVIDSPGKRTGDRRLLFQRAAGAQRCTAGSGAASGGGKVAARHTAAGEITTEACTKALQVVCMRLQYGSLCELACVVGKIGGHRPRDRPGRRDAEAPQSAFRATRATRIWGKARKGEKTWSERITLASGGLTRVARRDTAPW